MTARLSEEDEAYLRRSCEESGVPVIITDPLVIARAAETLKSATPTVGGAP